MTEGSTAFAPGHVTGFFSVHRASDPRRAGSRGAGVTLTDGVTATVVPGDDTGVTLNGEAVDVPAVEGVLDAMGVTGSVVGKTSLPVGAGFGVSGGFALATALAANHATGGGYSENELVGLAHVAEVEASTGLGDVVAQARGGVPIRLEPGAPPHGRLDGVPETGRIEYVSFGELSTPAVLGGDTDRLSEAGGAALERLRADPTLATFVRESHAFAREAGLLADDLEAVIEGVEDAGGRASMAMLGRTVFATGTGLSDAGYDPAACRIHPAGATLVE